MLLIANQHILSKNASNWRTNIHVLTEILKGPSKKSLLPLVFAAAVTEEWLI